MAKIYTSKKLSTPKMEPKKETVSFLLSYSKALSFIKIGKLNFENIAN
ncbi:MAG: hypothetical protein H7250_12575 [Flavobacterium sp.]|nr:hypothetical protein [Flavobacterium sp.]